ncbi:MAG: hypothetical protein H6733_13505 [Alphaproteobacteria bacterium]|nr:hypothetical protein [Alphaproteobacteria bacterium]
MAAFDLRNNEQSGQQLRGLSGGSVRWVYLDDANSFYNFRLREHYTDDDLAEQPERLWQASDHPDAEGLRSHIADALTAGERFSDILLILSADDYDNLSDDDPAFKDRIVEVLRARYAEFLAKSAVTASTRPLGVWIVRDGSDEVGGMDRSLLEGQFITGVLPNLYRGRGPHSRPIIGLHVNIPGYWEGYREVGQLHDDQTLFTLGNSWLDNFSHPNLREAALYGLQRDDDGAFFHIINPDLGDRYQITTTDQGGVSVITLATRDGVPLAYIVLAVIEQTEEEALAGLGGEPVPAPEPIHRPKPLGDHTPLALDASEAPALEPAALPPSVTSRGPGSKTIIPEAQNERIFTLQERGALLQKVHFSAFMLGYDVYLGLRGELGTVVDQPAATFQVRKRTVSLLANADNVVMDGEPIPQGESRLIEGDAVIQVGNQRLEYRELRHIELEGWPYVGEIRRPPSSTYMLWGREYTIGRSRDCRVVLPDEPRNDNIVWKPKVGDGATIKSKTGEIPKSRFYTDSIMVASEHAAIELLGDVPELSCHARHCYTFVRRQGEVLSLFPTTEGDAAHKVPLVSGDEVLVGNCVFHISFAAGDDLGAVAPAPAPRVSSNSLVDAVSAPEHTQPPPEAHEPEPMLPPPAPVEPEPALGNLPELSMDEPVAPPRIEPAAEAALAAAQRSWPEAMDDAMADASDSPPPVRPPRAPAPPPPSAPSASIDMPAPPAPGGVVVVDDQDAQFELGRPARLVQVGWAVNGSVTCGNHAGADLVLPENRIEADQQFEPTDYFALRIRGRRGKLEDVSSTEVRVNGAPSQPSYDSVDGLVISVIRRDDEGEEDFTVDLTVTEDPALPDPRARLVSIDTDEPLAVALITRGFPVRAPRLLELNGLQVTGTFDGTRLLLSEYLAGYRTASGFRAFFVQTDGGRFVTAPEDGSPLELSPGDRIVIDGAVFRFDVT